MPDIVGTKLLLVFVFTSLALGFVQAPREDSIEALIQRLGSADFRQRELATKALLTKPESETALRAAIASKDAEIAGRAAVIIAKFEAIRSPFVELDKAIKSGHIERAIELIAEFPDGKDDDALWERIQRLCFELCDRHNKTAGSTEPLRREAQPLRPRMKVARFDNGCWSRVLNENAFLVRAGQIDFSRVIGFSRQRVSGFSGVATGLVRLDRLILSRANIFTKGSVEIHQESLEHCLIVSAGNVVLDKISAVNCVIIARGGVHAQNTDLNHCRIVSGKSVSHRADGTYLSIITENEPNPLGYVRWEQPAQASKPKK